MRGALPQTGTPQPAVYSAGATAPIGDNGGILLGSTFVAAQAYLTGLTAFRDKRDPGTGSATRRWHHQDVSRGAQIAASETSGWHKRRPPRPCPRRPERAVCWW